MIFQQGEGRGGGGREVILCKHPGYLQVVTSTWMIGEHEGSYTTAARVSYVPLNRNYSILVSLVISQNAF